jgi:hypothetical protein
MRAVYVRAFASFETVGVEEAPDPQPGEVNEATIPISS